MTEWVKELNEDVHITIKNDILDIDDDYSPFIFIGIKNKNEITCIANVDGEEMAIKLLAYAAMKFAKQLSEDNIDGE